LRARPGRLREPGSLTCVTVFQPHPSIVIARGDPESGRTRYAAAYRCARDYWVTRVRGATRRLRVMTPLVCGGIPDSRLQIHVSQKQNAPGIARGAIRNVDKSTYVLLSTCQAGISFRPAISFCKSPTLFMATYPYCVIAREGLPRAHRAREPRKRATQYAA